MDHLPPRVQKLSLETSLHEKDAQILTLTIAHNASAADTQRSHQRLLVEQQHTTELTQQVDSATWPPSRLFRVFIFKHIGILAFQEQILV